MTETTIRLTPPLSNGAVERLRAGDRIFISGVIYAARAAALQRMQEAIEIGEGLPIDIRGQIIFFAGPSPTRPGNVTGSIGPTTSSMLDPYSLKLIELGLKGMIGKGARAENVIETMRLHKAVYLGVTGGAAALIARAVRGVEVVAYQDLGPEALRRLEVEDFPAVVVNDIEGNDLYRDGAEQYRRT